MKIISQVVNNFNFYYCRNGDDFEMSGSNVDAVIACPPCGENLVCSEGVCICKPGFVESPVTHMCLPLTHPGMNVVKCK